MKFLTKKGEASPHAPGPVRVLATNRIFELVGECPCTDWPLHYLVRLPNGGLLTMQHTEIEMIKE